MWRRRDRIGDAGGHSIWQSGFGKAFNRQHTAMGAKNGKAKQTLKDY